MGPECLNAFKHFSIVYSRFLNTKNRVFRLIGINQDLDYFLAQGCTQVMLTKIVSYTHVSRACMTSYDRPECRDG